MTRATDLPKEARAFLDALAIGESGGADDDEAYSVLYGGGHFLLGPYAMPSASNGQIWPSGFPQWSGMWVKGIPTHAAGRYQFEPRTWAGLGGGSFDPVSQDHKAWEMACKVCPPLATVSNIEGQEAIIAIDLRSTWTSLSPETFPDRYRECLAKLS